MIEVLGFYLRPFIESDITEKYLSWFQDAEVCKYTSHGVFGYTKKQAIEFLENSDKKGDLIWAIIVKGTKWSKNSIPKSDYHYTAYYELHIGNIALQNINNINRTAEFAGIIGEKDYWGKGIGTKAIQLLFKHGFNKLNIHKIYLGTAEYNKGMIRIAEKLGMTQEGCLCEHVFLNGEYQDVVRYGILKHEWSMEWI